MEKTIEKLMEDHLFKIIEAEQAKSKVKDKMIELLQMQVNELGIELSKCKKGYMNSIGLNDKECEEIAKL